MANVGEHPNVVSLIGACTMERKSNSASEVSALLLVDRPGWCRPKKSLLVETNVYRFL